MIYFGLQLGVESFYEKMVVKRVFNLIRLKKETVKFVEKLSIKKNQDLLAGQILFSHKRWEEYCRNFD